MTTDNPLDKPPTFMVYLSDKEHKLLLKLREIGWGRVVVFMENHQPTRIEESIKGSKL